jgi:hypothetical protein
MMPYCFRVLIPVCLTGCLLISCRDGSKEGGRWQELGGGRELWVAVILYLMMLAVVKEVPEGWHSEC